jgi:hypothetical protein
MYQYKLILKLLRILACYAPMKIVRVTAIRILVGEIR